MKEKTSRNKFSSREERPLNESHRLGSSSALGRLPRVYNMLGLIPNAANKEKRKRKSVEKINLERK